MKLSELIAVAQQRLAEHGDLEVMRDWGDRLCDLDATSPDGELLLELQGAGGPPHYTRFYLL